MHRPIPLHPRSAVIRTIYAGISLQLRAAGDPEEPRAAVGATQWTIKELLLFSINIFYYYVSLLLHFSYIIYIIDTIIVIVL